MTAAISKRSHAFSETEIDGEVVVMNLDRGDFFSLSGTAAAIWPLIDGQHDRAALIAAMTAEYGGEPGAVAADVDAFLAQLGAAGLIDGV